MEVEYDHDTLYDILGICGKCRAIKCSELYWTRVQITCLEPLEQVYEFEKE